MSKVKIYRDILYFDTNKVQSILAQMNKGLIKSVLETSDSEHKINADLKTNKLFELLLQLPISGQGGYQYIKSSGLHEEKSLHDFALTELIKSLPLKDVTSLKRSQLSIGNNRNFVRVKGTFSLYDYEDLARTLERMNIIEELMEGAVGEDDVIDKFADFIKTAYEGLTAIEISNRENVKFLGAINTEFLRETMRNFLFKYGSNPKGNWEMICQITKIPNSTNQDMQSLMSNLGKGINTKSLNTAKSLGPFMNNIVTEFSKINDMFSSVSYPDISVEPIAVYKEIKL